MLKAHFTRFLIVTKGDETRVAEVVIWCPFNVLKLSYQHRFQPATLGHFFSG